MPLRLHGLVELLLVNSTGEGSAQAPPLHLHGAENVPVSVGVLGGGGVYGGQGESVSVPPGELWFWVPAISPAGQNRAAAGVILQGYDWGGGCTWG